MHEQPTPPDKSASAAETPPAHETEPKPKPAIYVASLADYNNGVLHGRWIDAAREPDDIYADIDAMLDSSCQPGAEEWAIHDYEQFGSWRVGEHDIIDDVAQVAKGIAEHGYAYAAWADVFDGEAASFDTEAFTEAYLGHYDSVTDYVEQLADDLGYERELDTLPDHLRQYIHIDYAAIARDMELSGDVVTVADPAGGIWLFSANT